MLVDAACPSSSGVVKKGICSKPQGLLGDLRVRGPGGNSIKLKRLQAAPSPVGAWAHALLFSDWKMRRGSNQKGTHGGTTSGFQLASCGTRIMLRHMHTETHSSSRQGLAWCVTRGGMTWIIPLKWVTQNRLDGLYNTACRFPFPRLFPLLLFLLVLSSSPLHSPSSHSILLVPTVHCRLFLASVNYGWNCHFGAHGRKGYKDEAEGLARSGWNFNFTADDVGSGDPYKLFYLSLLAPLKSDVHFSTLWSSPCRPLKQRDFFIPPPCKMHFTGTMACITLHFTGIWNTHKARPQVCRVLLVRN